MSEPDDHQLLAEFARAGSGAAFAALVARHVNLVFSTAIRATGNAHHAEDITQAVFIILARKAEKLSPRVVVSGWLYQVARLTSANFMKGEIRRQRREQEAYMQAALNEPHDDVWLTIAPLLDEAMAKLGQTDRDAVVLRYFENKSAAEIGAALRMNEETARKRVNRALEKLHRYFRRRGISSTTAIIAGAITTHSVQAAPVALANTVSAAAVAKGAAASTSTLTLVKGTLKIMAWTKIKTATLAGVAFLLTAGGTTMVVKSVAQPVTATASDEIWNQYYQVLADSTNNATLGEAGDKLMRSHPPMAAIRLTPSERRSRPQFRVPGVPGRARGWGTELGHVALGMPLPMVLMYAYNLDPTNFPSSRIVMPPELANVPYAQAAQYDYFDTMPKGGREKLQQELKDQWGLVVRRELRQNLVLRVKTPGASGLHPHGTSGTGFRANNVTMPRFAKELRLVFGVNVTDATGLDGGYDFTLDLPQPPKPEDLKQALADQLGLELTPAPNDQGVEFIVVENTKQKLND